MVELKTDSESNKKALTDGLEPPKVSLRWTLVTLGAFIYFIGFMLRNSMSVTIVAMVNTTKAITDDNYNTSFSCQIANETSEETSYNYKPEFDWDSSIQGLVLSGYLWGYFIGRVLGGRIGEVFGQRETVALGMTLGGIMELLTPVAATISPYLLVAVRILMGLFHGPMYPSLTGLVSKWVLRSQLATTVTIIYLGAPFGGMIGVLTAGWIIDGLGWRWVFYIQGIVPFIWIPIWWILVRNDPAKHPLISPYELALLSENKSVTTKKSAPWKKVFTCPYVYVCMYCQFARAWIDVVGSAAGPSFFNKQIGIELSKASLVCAMGSLTALPAMIIYGQVSDFIIRNKYVTKLLGRRIFQGIGTIGPSLVYIGIVIAGCHVAAVISLWPFIGLFMSATTVSISLSVIDFAPNYAGTISGLLGIGNGFASFGPIIISSMVKQENGWNHMFYLAIGFSMISFLLYTFIMTDKPMAWNYDEEDTNEKTKTPITNEAFVLEEDKDK